MNMRQPGFTLIEMLIYSVMISVIVFSFSLLLMTILQARAKNIVIAEVEQQGQFMTDILEQTVRNAESITTPTAGTSGSTLQLDVLDVANDPTIFAISSSTLQITQGAGAGVNLHSADVEISGFTVEHVQNNDSVGSLHYSFTLTHINPANQNAFDYAKDFQGAATLRQ